MTKYNKREGNLSGRGVFTDDTVHGTRITAPHEKSQGTENDIW